MFQDSSLPINERVDDLISQMTLEEKISQMQHEAPAIDRLGVPKYVWWNECLHGVGRAGIATVFPQAIGLAATWNEDLMLEVATAISDEARAKHHEAVRNGIREIYRGLTFWSPNINIFRDPRWGRGQETYGEDPHLTTRLGVAFVKGLQGDDPNYLKVVATPKHFAVHSGPEEGRHEFDSITTERDLWETYLPAFEATVIEAGAKSVMGAYNRVNGEASCASPTLLQQILRDQWGFDGYVVSDCGAIFDIYANHKIVETPEQAAALAVKNGCELNCGAVYPALLGAVAQGLITEAEIDVAVKRLFEQRFRLGMFDPPEQVAYAQIPIEVNDSAENRQLSLRAAQESIVLLKNDGILPLSKDLRSIAVIGPNADEPAVLLGNYNGTPSLSFTPAAGIRAKLSGSANVFSTQGCDIRVDDESGFADALALAQQADVVIYCCGLSQKLEGEENLGDADPEFQSFGDRKDIDLPAIQQRLLEQIHATGTPVVMVLINGSAIAVNWANDNLPAIVECWYPGQEGGTALADVLFGDYNPGGRLPVTFYKSTDDLPPFESYSMKDRTYRYFYGDVLFPFGHGLSYTQFEYSNLQFSETSIAKDGQIAIRVDVQNVGQIAGDEVVQLYIEHDEFIYQSPIRQLKGIKRVNLQPQQKRTLEFVLSAETLALSDDLGQRNVVSCTIAITVGGGQPLDGVPHVAGRFEIV